MQTMGIITTTASPAAVHIIHTWRTAKCLHKQEFLYHFFLFCSFSRGTKSKHSLKTWAIKIWISIFNPFLMKKNYCLKFWTFPELPDNADLHLVAFVLVVGFGKCHVGVLISVVLPITSIMEPQLFLNLFFLKFWIFVPVIDLLAAGVLVVLRQEEHEVDDDPRSQEELDWQDGVNLLDEATPNRFVPEVQTCCNLFILRNGHPSLVGFIFDHVVWYNDITRVVSQPPCERILSTGVTQTGGDYWRPLTENSSDFPRQLGLTFLSAEQEKPTSLQFLFENINQRADFGFNII